MPKFLLLKTYFLVFSTLVFGPTVFALGINEVIEVKSLGYLADDNVLLLNRGLVDDIEEGEHLQLYYKDVFIGRAYSLELENHRSIWLVYQIADESPLIEKGTLKARRLPQRFVPKRVKNGAGDVRVDEVKPDLLAQAPQESPEPIPPPVIKGGYKESNKEDKEEIPVSENGSSYALNPNTSLQEDVDDDEDDPNSKLFNVQLTAAPIKFSTLFDSREISYGTNIQSADLGNKVLGAHYVYSHRRSRPSNFTQGVTGIATSSSYDAGLNFDVNRITKRLSFFSFATFQRQRDGTFYPVRYRYNLAPVGLKYEFFSSEKIPELSLSYTPIMEIELNDVITTQTVQIGTDSFGNPLFETRNKAETTKFQRARHSFRFGFKWIPAQNFFMSNVFWYRPSHDLSNKVLDWEDARLSNDFQIGYNPNESITLGYQNVYTWDILQKRVLGLPSSVMDHIFQVSYNFSI